MGTYLATKGQQNPMPLQSTTEPTKPVDMAQDAPPRKRLVIKPSGSDQHVSDVGPETLHWN
jgi:hypothetical protein